MYAHPGKKLIFMGGEFGQRNEWYHERGLDWHLLSELMHAGLKRWVEDLNSTYATEAALHELDFDQGGFGWVDFRDYEQSVISFERKGRSGEVVLVVCNFTPVPRENYRVGIDRGGRWRELLNSDAVAYGGSGWGNFGSVEAEEVEAHGRRYSLPLTLPPLGVLYLKPAVAAEAERGRRNVLPAKASETSCEPP